jgi:YbbR domain-containing protein
MKLIKTIFKPLIIVLKFLYKVLDKVIVTPISKLIYKSRDLFKSNNSRIEKILNSPNVLIYFSLVCAVGLFLLVDSEVINLNSSEAQVLSDQPIEVLYNAQTYIVEGVPETVDITLIGSGSALYLANRSSNNKVSLDLSNYGVGTYKVKLKYNSASTSISYKLDPSTVTVKISSKLSEERNLGYDLLNEQSLDQRLSISKVELNTSSVVVKSSKEILDKVSVVKALVDVKDLGVTTSGEYQIEGVKLVAYDSKGDKVNNVEFVPDSVTATITLNSYSAVKPVKVVTTGQMQSGYAIDSITSSVSNVTVYGSQSVVDSLDYIEAVVNVDKLNSNVNNKAYDLVVPNGIRYMSSSTTQVSIKVGAETQKVLEKVPIRIENLSSELNALAVNEENQKIDIIVKGTENVVNAITAEDVKVYVDLSGLGQGVQKVTVQVSCSDTRVTLNAVTQEVEIKLNKK